MPDVRVTCISRVPRDDPHEGITHLGSQNWRWSRQEVIDSINNRTSTFYTLANGRRADVRVVNGPHGQYVRTYADGVWNENLLALPECVG
jgi:hypothetical protein